MEPNETGTCQVKMHDGSPCGRPLYDHEHCICHSEDPKKDFEKFCALVGEAHSRDTRAEGVHDFTRFVFPDGMGFPELESKGLFVFDGAEFLGSMSFKGAIFPNGATFAHANFRGDVNFRSSRLGFAEFSFTEFFGDCDFTHLQIKRVFQCHDTNFRKASEFGAATFSGGIHIWRTEFLSDTSFGHCECGGRAIFHDVKFHGLTSFSASRKIFLAARNAAVFNGTLVFESVEFHKETTFERATFDKSATFSDVSFADETSFEKTHFNDDANFDHVDFDKRVHFRGTHFLKENIWGPVRFMSDADFSGAVFGGKSEFKGCVFRKGLFNECVVQHDASFLIDDTDSEYASGHVPQLEFRGCTFLNPLMVKFRNVNLRETLFLETDIRAVEFAGETWPTAYKYIKQVTIKSRKRAVAFRFGRKLVYDEIRFMTSAARKRKWGFGKKHFDSRYSDIAQLYRRLQDNYARNYKYSEGGDFHIGEQIMMRKMLRFWQPRWLVSWFYNCFSRYGENFLLPLAWLALVITVSPLVLLFGGVKLACNTYAVYDLKTLGVLLVRPDDYCACFWKNLCYVSYSRTGLYDFITHDYQIGLIVAELVLIITFITLFLLALKRKFKRKSF